MTLTELPLMPEELFGETEIRCDLESHLHMTFQTFTKVMSKFLMCSVFRYVAAMSAYNDWKYSQKIYPSTIQPFYQFDWKG